MHIYTQCPKCGCPSISLAEDKAAEIGRAEITNNPLKYPQFSDLYMTVAKRHLSQTSHLRGVPSSQSTVMEVQERAGSRHLSRQFTRSRNGSDFTRQRR